MSQRRKNIGGSLLPSSEKRILQPLRGPFGTFQVFARAEMDTHALFLNDLMVASHPNGFTCYNLAERIVDVWAGRRVPEYAMKQFDYLLSCAGTGLTRENMERVVSGKGMAVQSAREAE